mmetsp:Transcript_25355/g.78262  ORF Transcript_25355/g.78262 Transcript_25355/m.78262 type:complete len:276 (+) Transcript_25355:226-1053(+)
MSSVRTAAVPPTVRGSTAETRTATPSSALDSTDTDCFDSSSRAACATVVRAASARAAAAPHFANSFAASSIAARRHGASALRAFEARKWKPATAARAPKTGGRVLDSLSESLSESESGRSRCFREWAPRRMRATNSCQFSKSRGGVGGSAVPAVSSPAMMRSTTAAAAPQVLHTPCFLSSATSAESIVDAPVGSWHANKSLTASTATDETPSASPTCFASSAQSPLTNRRATRLAIAGAGDAGNRRSRTRATWARADGHRTASKSMAKMPASCDG